MSEDKRFGSVNPFYVTDDVVDNIYKKSNEPSLSEKLKILGMAAKYDVSCASSGVDRKGSGSSDNMGSSMACGICHSFTADGRCVSLLKILLSNDCVYDCKYCINRRSNDVERASFSVEEVVSLTINFYKRNYIEGLFLSSAVKRSPDDTMLEICRILYKLRFEEGFFGYIHCKAIPGADSRLIEFAGRLADRMSVNIEMPSERSLLKVAPQKSKADVFRPMRYIKERIAEDLECKKIPYGGSSFLSNRNQFGAPLQSRNGSVYHAALPNAFNIMPKSYDKSYRGVSRSFVPAGQSTQMIVGATDDTDFDILRISQALYGKMELKRVYYSAYIAINDDPVLPKQGTVPPLLREHRLYQADWLLRFYDFSVEELFENSNGSLNSDYDPKCDWALRHLDMFPVEINKADYQMLLRVPGIGVKTAKRIIASRRYGGISFDSLKKMGAVMKRAALFITCGGKMYMPITMEPEFIKANLSLDKRAASSSAYTPISLFDNVV